MIVDFSINDFSVYSGRTLCTKVLLSDVKISGEGLPCLKTNEKLNGKRKNTDNYIHIVSAQTSIYYDSENINYLAQNLTNTLQSSLREANMMLIYSSRNDNTFKNPWFNEKCLSAKRNMKKCYKLLRENNYDHYYMYYYKQSKKHYKHTINYNKSLYEKEVLNKMRNITNSYEFWITINEFKKIR